MKGSPNVNDPSYGSDGWKPVFPAVSTPFGAPLVVGPIQTQSLIEVHVRKDERRVDNLRAIADIETGRLTAIGRGGGGDRCLLVDAIKNLQCTTTQTGSLRTDGCHGSDSGTAADRRRARQTTCALSEQLRRRVTAETLHRLEHVASRSSRRRRRRNRDGRRRYAAALILTSLRPAVLHAPPDTMKGVANATGSERSAGDSRQLRMRRRIGRDERRHVDRITDGLIARAVDHVAKNLLRVLNGASFGVAIAEKDEFLLLSRPKTLDAFLIYLWEGGKMT